MIKIITKKKYLRMLAQIEDLSNELEMLRGAHQNLHQLRKGQWNKFTYEDSELKKKIESLELANENLTKRLNKAEHDKNVALKRLKKYES